MPPLPSRPLMFASELLQARTTSFVPDLPKPGWTDCPEPRSYCKLVILCLLEPKQLTLFKSSSAC